MKNKLPITFIVVAILILLWVVKGIFYHCYSHNFPPNGGTECFWDFTGDYPYGDFAF